jgi:hypothetical protein
MNFQFSVSRNANHYFFLDTLSGRHPRARTHANDAWRKKYSECFLRDVENALKDFAAIRGKYPMIRSIFERAFYRSSNPWRVLDVRVGKRDLQRLREIFAITTPVFEKIFRDEEKKLSRWEALLRKSFSSPAKSDRILRTLSGLYGVAPKIRVAHIVLLISAEHQLGGGANTDKNSLTLEVSGIPLTESARVFGVLYHELTHLVFEGPKLFRLLYLANVSDRDDLREYINRAFFPQGVLGRTFLGREPSPREFAGWTDRYIELLALAERYVQEKRRINADFVRAFIALKK